MSFTEAVRSVYSNYANFNGRASRSEFWWFVAFFFLVYLGFLAAIVVLPRGMWSLALLLYVVFAIGSIVPNLAVSVRRLHDTSRSGWWLLISFIPFGGLILLVFWVMDSDRMPNQYGPPPGGQAWPGYGSGHGGQATYGWQQQWPNAPTQPSQADVHPLSRNPPPPTGP